MEQSKLKDRSQFLSKNHFLFRKKMTFKIKFSLRIFVGLFFKKILKISTVSGKLKNRLYVEFLGAWTLYTYPWS